MAPSTPVVPGYVPLALLVGLEVVAIAAWFSLAGAAGFRKGSASVLSLCTRCTRLHGRTELIGLGADAVAVGAVAFLIALPFVAAGYEGGLAPGIALLGASAVVAFLAVAAELDFLIRALAARIWPNLSWQTVEATRIIGGGARWVGVILAMYIFKAAYSSVGVSALFGDVGKRLATDLPSIATLTAAAAILVVAMLAALLSRWLVPMIFNSLPTTLALRHEAPGRRR
ncbi:MAG: hypothetical protein ACRENA_07825 [Vulcanimicrobiaceae bacterium]